MAVRLTDKILPLNDAFEGLVDANQIVQTPGGFKDEDDMASDSNTAFCSQQSIKKYVDDNVGSGESGHATVAALIAATVTEGDITHTRGYLSEGDGGAMVYEVKTGLSASVDGGSVIDLGDSLYAEAKFFERVNPIMWGAKANDNATLVATANVTATNAMFDYIAVSMTTGGALPVKFPQGKFYVNDKIILPRERNVISILHDIDLNGCNIIGLVHSGGDNYPVIARLKSDIDDVYIGASDPEGVNITATRINIYNGSITGPNKNYVDRNDATKCLQLQCLYNPIVQNISFGTAGVCLSMQFCLNADVRNNLYGSFKYGLRLTSTKNYTGFSSTGSGKGQSNASTVFKDRFYCNDVTGTALEVSSSNMVTIQECIIEGGAILHAIHIIGNFDTTVNHIKINTLHLEVADSGTNEGVVGAGIRVSSWLGGDVYIEHIYYQYSGACFSKNRSAWTNTSGATDGDYREIEQSAGDITTDSTSGVNAIMGLTVAGGVITEWGLDGLSDTSTGFEAGDVLTIPAGVLGVGSTAATFTLRRRDLTETGVIKGGNPLVDVVGMTNAGRCHFNPVYWVPGTTLKHQWSQSQANATRWLFAGEAPAELVLKGGGGSGTYRINTSKFLPPLLYSNIDTVAGTFDTTVAGYTFDSVSTPIWLAWREHTTDSTSTSYYYNSDYPYYMMASNVGDSFGGIYKGSTTIQGANMKLAGFSSNGNIYGYVMATYNAVVLNAPYYCRVLSPRIRHERNTSDYVEFIYPAASSGGVSLYYPSEDGTLALTSDVAINTAAIAALPAAIDYSGAISANTTLITSNDTDIATNVTNIAANTAHAASAHAPSGATVNSADADLKARANHTGTQAANTISDFDAEVANNSAVIANSDKTSFSDLTGEVTSVGAATTISDGVVDEANLKVSNNPTDGHVLSAQSGNAGGLTWVAAGSGGTDVTLAGSRDYITISGQEITRNAIDLTADVTGVLPSANLDTDTAHLSGVQNFTGAKVFSAGITPSFIKHTISGNGAADYGPGADILYGISNETTTAGAIYVLRSGTWVLINATLASTSRQLCAVAVGNNSSTDGMLIRGCVTLASTLTAGTDVEGIQIYASATAGQATITAPSSSGNVVRVLGYSLNVGSKKIFFDPDKTWLEI